MRLRGCLCTVTTLFVFLESSQLALIPSSFQSPSTIFYQSSPGHSMNRAIVNVILLIALYGLFSRADNGTGSYGSAHCVEPGKLKKRRLPQKKNASPSRYGGVPYQSLLCRVSMPVSATLRTLGGATRRVPLVPIVERAIDASMHTIPNIPASASDTNYGGACGVDFSGRRGSG